MIGANSLHSVGFALLLFLAIYFAALGIYELKKLITRKQKERKNKKGE